MYIYYAQKNVIAVVIPFKLSKLCFVDVSHFKMEQMVLWIFHSWVIFFADLHSVELSD